MTILSFAPGCLHRMLRFGGCNNLQSEFGTHGSSTFAFGGLANRSFISEVWLLEVSFWRWWPIEVSF